MRFLRCPVEWTGFEVNATEPNTRRCPEGRECSSGKGGGDRGRPTPGTIVGPVRPALMGDASPGRYVP
jgi:hypothetical protein